MTVVVIVTKTKSKDPVNFSLIAAPGYVPFCFLLIRF